MVGARTEAGPTAPVADTHTVAVPMQAAGRTTPAVAEGTSAQDGRVEEAEGISAAAGATADSGTESGAVGRRDIRRRRGRVAARTEARRHGNQAGIPRVVTAAEVTGVRGVDTTAGVMVRADRVIAAADTATTAPAAVDRVMAETADLMAARDKAGRTAMHTATTPTGIRAPVVAATGRRQIAAILE